MKTLGNIIWFIFIGLWEALGFIFVGAILCITIIGIPFGKQCFKLAQLVLTPFGHPQLHISTDTLLLTFSG